MVEPKAKVDMLAPFASEVKGAVGMLDGKNPAKTQSSHQPYFPHPPTHHVGPHHHPGSQTEVDPGHHIERIIAIEAELQRTREELTKSKEQLVASETGRAQALKEFTNIKNLLDQISLVEHFAASDNIEVEAAPLPPNWRASSTGQLDTATPTEFDRLRNELEASKHLTAKLAAELDNAKQEIDRVQHGTTSLELESSRMETSSLQSELEAGRGQYESICLELGNAKKEISTLQTTLSDAWSQHGACALDLARAKEEIGWLETDLDAAQSLTVKLAHAKDDIITLQEGLEVARELQKTSSIGLLKAKEEISSLRRQHEASSLELVTAIESNNAFRAELEILRGLNETSSMELQNAKNEILVLRTDYGTSISECVIAKDEIRELQVELTAALTSCRDSATELRSTEEEVDKLQTKLELVVGQHDRIYTELSEALGQIEKLKAELEASREKYETCSSELFNTKKHVFRLETEQLASHESLTADIIIAQDENLRLQADLAAFKAEKVSLSTELAKAREEINHVQVKLEATGKRHNTACTELFFAGKDVARLQGELSVLEVQHEECCTELATLKDIFMDFQIEVTQVQELHNIVLVELISAKDEIAKLQLGTTDVFESSLDVVRGLKEEIGEVQTDLSMQFTSLILEKFLTQKRLEELTLELMATNAHLQKATAAQMKAEAELAATTKETVAASTLRADLEAIRAELVIAREAESKLEGMMLEVEELGSQTTFNNNSKAASLTPESNAGVDALHAELAAIKVSDANHRETVNSSQAQIETLKSHLFALRDSEAKAKESLVTTNAELQKMKTELVIAKGALEWVDGDAAALSAELEALKTEVTTTKEGEAKAKAAFTDYSLKLQKMRLDLEDASKLADKARTFKLDLDEANAKLQKVTESERIMSASMASLRAEFNNARTELETTREDIELTLAEKDQQYELELNQMKEQREAAVMSETKLTDANFALNESLIKVMAEAEEATFAAGQATEEAEKARQEVEQAQAHIETIEAKLQALLLEVEAVKANEEWAFTEIKVTSPEYVMETGKEQGGKISIEEYRKLIVKTKDLQELVNKRVALGTAQVDAAKASEKEMQLRIETLEKELRGCRSELSEAVDKREEAEAAKFSCEAALRAKRLEGKSLSHSGALNGGHPMGKLVNAGDRQGSMNSICFEDSQSSSPTRSSLSVASFASPGRQERSPVESIAQLLTVRMPAEEKQKKPKLSSKIGAYFSKKKESAK